ncbi:unnamed protein product [Toxocara canis]|uniref:Uncharacterized protein n=1 Tax=Toxocara canis TaxID=6265 RepID=A0A183U3I5_TOXCA|nr:unnamed protein product [Toxocara canis]
MKRKAVYVAPTLYVVHNDTLEILQIAEYEGPDSRTLLDVRDCYRCHCAHYIGRGRTPKEVMFVLSSSDRTEIHAFCGVNERKSWIFEYKNAKCAAKEQYIHLTKHLRQNEDELRLHEKEDDGSRGDVRSQQTAEVLRLYGDESLV